MKRRTNLRLSLVGAALAGFVLTASPSRADLVAYWPLNDGPHGSTVTGADDVIDAGLTFTDATINNSAATWFADPVRGLVFNTVENNRLTAGTQGIDLNDGFTWSFWAKVASSNIVDAGADCLMGTRNGAWNKIDLVSTSNWVNVTYPNLADDTWHHIVYVGDLGGVNIYLDGVPRTRDTTFNPAGTTAVNVRLEIGGTSQFNEDITGLMSDVAIWNEALSEARIQELAAGASILPDTTPPILAATMPVDDDPAAPLLPELKANFDEPVVLGAGDIRIINLTDSVTTTIAVSDASQVSVSGALLTITPTVPLVIGKDYAVELDAGVVKNASASMDFAGISGTTAWNFRFDSTAPVLISTTPANDATGVSVTAALTATFDEPVAVGSGNITLKNLSAATDTLIAVTDATQVSVAGAVLTILPNLSPTPGDRYAIQIDSGAIENLSGYDFAGIVAPDVTSWTFSNATLAIGARQFNPHPPDPQTPSPIAAVSTDLLETSLLEITRDNGSAPNFGVTPNWHNGLTSTAAGTAYDVTGSHGENGVEIHFDVSTNTEGYDIDEIRVFTAGSGYDGTFSKVGQSFNIAVQSVADAGSHDNATFVNLGDVLADPGGALDPGGILMTRSYDASGVPIATGISAIKLATKQVVGPSGAALNWTRNRVQEIDVIGTAVGAPDVAPFNITAIDYSTADSMLTLTWDSKEGAQYSVKYSGDMTNWEADLDDGITADAGTTTTRRFDLAQAGLAGEGRFFLRVERQP